MTRQKQPSRSLYVTLCRSTLELMEVLATSMLNEHADQVGLRAACGSAWLCERVVLAEDSLAVV